MGMTCRELRVGGSGSLYALQDIQTLRRERTGLNLPTIEFVDSDFQFQIGQGQHPFCLLGPLRNFQALAGKDFAETSFFKFFRLIESIEIKMPNGKAQAIFFIQSLMGLDHGIGWAFDAALDTQGLQQMPDQGRSGPQGLRQESLS